MNCLLLFFAFFPLANALSSNDYGPTFAGDGTYYGFTTGGNCAIRAPLPRMYNGMVPVAMNNEQYGNSDACGACLLVTGTSRGAGANPIKGTFKAYVMDRCPECKKGDLDLSKSGDGRWRIKWKFIPCPGEIIFFLFEGSNDYYWKLQPRGSKYPIQKVIIDGMHGMRTQDNFFVFHTGGRLKTPVTVVMKDTFRRVITLTLIYFNSDGPVFPSGYSRGTTPARCVPKWKACTGPRNLWKTSRCCSSRFRCVTASSPGFIGKRCEPKV